MPRALRKLTRSRYLQIAALLLLPGMLCLPAFSQRGRRALPPPRPFGMAPRGQPRAAAPAQLGKGLEELYKLPPEQREQKLRSDPNFQKLPPERQRQLLNGLRRLNAMTPEQQRRVIQRLHDLGELTPRQRRGLEGIFQQFQGMPPERRRAFRAAYNNLRQLPPEQREQRMSRPQFQQRFSPQELETLHQALELNLPADVVGARPGGGF